MTRVQNIAYIYIYKNPLLHEFCFSSIFEIYLMRGSYRLPIHRRGDHLLISKSKFLVNIVPGPRYAAKG